MTLTINQTEIKTLYSAEQIQQGVNKLAEQINSDYKSLDNILVVGILKGAFVFTADLVRKFNFSHEVEFLKLSSYGSGTESSGKVKSYDLTLPPLENKNVIIIDDIVDSGRTAKFLLDFFANQKGIASVKLATLFDKPSRRIEELKELKPHYCCFEIEDKFILGYGLDYDQKFRSLDYVGYIEV